MGILGQMLPAAAPIVGGLMGRLFEGHDDQRQLDQNQKLQEQQIRGAKEMSQFQYEQEMKKWRETGYGAQKEMMIEADLNPALMYGMSGGGGQSSQSSGGAMPTSGQAPQGKSSAETSQNMGMMLQQGELMAAQIDKLKAEAENLRGVDRANTEADTGVKTATVNSLTQGITNQKLANELLQIQKRLDNTKATIAEGTLDSAMRRIDAEANTAYQEALRASNNASIEISTKNEKISQIRQQTINMGIEAIAMRQGIKLSEAQIHKIGMDIDQRAQEIEQGNERNEYEHGDRNKAIEQYATTALQNAGIQAAGNIISDLINLRKGKIRTSTRTERWDGDGNHTGGSQTTTIRP